MPNLHTKTQVLFAIYYSSVFIYLRHIYKEQICANPFFLFKKSSNAFILKVHVLPLYKFSSNIFKELLKSCFGSCKFAPILFAYLTGFSASFDHKSTSELEKRFSLTELLHFVAAILEIVVPLGQRRWPATENSIAQKGLLNYLAFCFACFTKTLISQAFKQLSWYSGALRPPLVSDQFSKML